MSADQRTARPTADDREDQVAGYSAEQDDDRLVCSVELEDEDGNPYRICQEPSGSQQSEGGGEFPDPDAPPRAPAPGAVGRAGAAS